MNLDYIKTFLLVAQKGSLSAAATDLGCNQTTVSRQLKGLEEEIGFSLFNRHARGITLTEQGVRYLNLCTEIIGQLGQVTALIKEEENEPQGTLKILLGIGTLVAMIPQLNIFLTNYPKINLKFHTVLDPFKIQTGEVDVFLSSSLSKDPDMIQHRIDEISLRIYAAPIYIEKMGRPKRIEDLKNHRLLVYKGDDDDDIFSKLDFHLEKEGLQGISSQSFIEMNNSIALREALLNGLGISVYWDDETLIKTGAIVDLFPEAPSEIVTFYFTYHKRLIGSSKIKAFHEFLHQVLNPDNS